MSRSWLLPTLVVTIAALLIALVFSLNRDSGDGATKKTSANIENKVQPISVLERRDPEDPLATGPVDAPLVLVVFSDYQCGFCAKWSNDTLPNMRKLTDTGDLRIEWRDTNVFGPDSERAARASYASALQDRFFEYSAKLFPAGKKRPPDQLTDAALTKVAGEIGLDTERFKRDFSAQTTATEIARNAQLGRDAGISSTPTFILGGGRIVGAQPPAIFDTAYKEALKTVR